ncbi:MAG TPA: nuclear transport factor 2 family protein [Sphingomicrobium sp.]
MTIASEVEEMSNRWMQAWVEQDRATLEQVLAPDYVLIVSAAADRTMDRATWLASCDRYVAQSFRYRSVQVHEPLPGMAVMSAVAEQIATLGDVDRSGSFFVTDIWRRAPDGRWQVCARYSSHPEPSGVSSAALVES